MTTAAAWEDMAPPLDLVGEPDDSPETSAPDTQPETKPCAACGEPIIRDPSWKRMHKYHDECQPTSHKASGEKRVTTGGKAEKEADRCEQILKGFLVKAALMVSVVDRYDAACIMMNTPAVCSSFRATCLRYAELRREFLKVPEGGSVLGLVFSVLMMAAPMAAHHGLIPSKRVAETIVRLPLVLYQLQAKLSQGEAGLQDLMREQASEIRKSREEAQARARAEANGQYVGPS